MGSLRYVYLSKCSIHKTDYCCHHYTQSQRSFSKCRKMRICAVKGCSNGTYTIYMWKKTECALHKINHGECTCDPPFVLYPFPTAKKNSDARKEWVRLIRRVDPVSKKAWEPKDNDRVCSQHFNNQMKSSTCPHPCINLGYVQPLSNIKKRSAPKERLIHMVQNKKQKLDNDTSVVNWDHRYTYRCDCTESEECNCQGCLTKQKQIKCFTSENEYLRVLITNARKDGHCERDSDICSTFLKSDVKVKAYTGLKDKATFDSLFGVLQEKAQKLQYWVGEKRTVIRSRTFKASPLKMGPQRKLSAKEEFLLVLMKLRLGVNSILLGDITGVSETTVSSIFNTWIKFLAQELQGLIIWPSREIIKSHLPSSLKHFKNLRCTIDCTEVFIERPRDRELQALTWSDYKKHNTVKFLIGIAPNGAISYLSKAWGGRASDRHITLADGFIDLVEPYDLIMADRGFNVRGELLAKFATLEIPPPSSGLEQMCTVDVKKTKKVANKRIHVERAINRIKWFAILQNTLPITLLPLIDDILTVCAALCNLLPNLVQ